MIRIVHFGKYYPPDMGGIESVTQSLAIGAQQAGYDVLVICFDKSQLGNKSDSNVQVQRYPITKMISSQPLSWAYLIGAIREGRKANIVHLHAPNLIAALAALFIGFKPKLIIHWHSDIVDKKWLGKLVKPLEYLVMQKAAIIIATSQRYFDGSKPLKLFSNKVRVVPIGISAPEIPKEEIYLSPRLAEFVTGRKLVLSVGRLTAYKGFSVIIDAANYLSDDIAIVIAGGGELLESLSELINSTQVGNKVMLAGRVTENELIALYTHADIFCLSSILRSEAFGVVLLEAMAYGLPIVATDIAGSGVPWVNAHDVSGINVPTGDAKALARACEQILNDAALHDRYSQGAKRRFNYNFTENIFWKNSLAEYSYLIK